MTTLTTFDFTNLPLLGNTETTNPSNRNQTTPAQQIFLGGFSGLFFEGAAANGNLRFITNTDRGPNGEPTNLINSIAGLERPFALPNFQPQLVRFELNRTSRQVTITQRIGLTLPDGSPISGLPNLQKGQQGTAYTDEVPVDLFGNLLTNQPLGADLEGIVVAPDGSFWLPDEYRPAIYRFDSTGKLIARFVPQGTTEPSNAATIFEASLSPVNPFGQEVLPAVYAQRRANRGFEAIALEGNKLYAFIQSAIDNPDSAADTTSRNSRNLRILEFDTLLGAVSGEYIYQLDSLSGLGNARTDKIGDAVSIGNGRFLVVERDDLETTASNKLIYNINLNGATNINNRDRLTGLPAGKTIEQLTDAELAAANIRPVSKSLVTNAATLGYIGVGKLEGLAVINSSTLAILNDNDFGVLASPLTGNGIIPLSNPITPIRLGLIEFDAPNFVTR